MMQRDAEELRDQAAVSVSKGVTGLAAMDGRTKALEEARDRAAAEPLVALRRMGENLEKTGKRKLAETVAFLVDHVFEPRVNAKFASEAVGSTTNAISPRLEKETGQSLPMIIAIPCPPSCEVLR